MTGTILSVAGTAHTVAGFAGMFGNSGSSVVSSKLIGTISLGLGVALLGAGIPLIVHGATATRKSHTEVCVSANGLLLRGTF